MDLGTLLDERAIYLQICALADAMDQRDWRALDHILTEDADGDFGTGEPVIGRAGFVALFSRFLENCGPTQHLIGNVRVQIHGDTAGSRCYIRDMHIGAGARAHLYMSSSGQYLDRWRRTPDGWRMTHRTKKTPILLGTIDALGIAPPASPPRGEQEHGESSMTLSAEDYFAIQNLVHTYPYLLDSGNFEGLGRLFARCKIYSGGHLMSDCNSETAAGMFRDWLYLYDGVPRTRHYLSNLIIEPQSPTRAIVRTYVTVHQQTDSLPLQPIIGGDYQDTVEKIDGQWRFVERRMANDLFGDLSVHGRDAGVITPARANTIDYR